METEIISKDSSNFSVWRSLITKKILWVVFASLCILVGLYPISFMIPYFKHGFLSLKNDVLISSILWNIGFYMHISFSGIALAIGWFLFIKKYRNKFLKLHRFLGKVYVITILLGGFSGLFISFYASGGLMAKMGFGFMAIAWLITTYKAYFSIRMKDLVNHEKWMIRSYSVTFAGVTFRLWLPFLKFVIGLDFFTLYPIDAWLCWVPNLILAEFIINSIYRKRSVLV